MYEGQQATQWNHSSPLIASIYNSRFGIKQNQIVGNMAFHPFIKKLRKSKRLSKEESGNRLDQFLGIHNAQPPEFKSR